MAELRVRVVAYSDAYGILAGGAETFYVVRFRKPDEFPPGAVSESFAKDLGGVPRSNDYADFGVALKTLYFPNP